MPEYQKSWSEYFKITKNKPPRPLLLEALKFGYKRNYALDLGAGALRDTRHLLSLGFDVTVVDSSPLVLEEATRIDSEKLHIFVNQFTDFAFPTDKYDIVCAMYSLPFNSPETFTDVFSKIKSSLIQGGIFCGQFFGIHDEWASNPRMTFHTKTQVESLLSDMDIVLLKEEEKDDKTASGDQKHWHVFHVIAKKV